MLMLRSVNKKIFIKTLVAKHRLGAAGRAVCYLISVQSEKKISLDLLAANTGT